MFGQKSNTGPTSKKDINGRGGKDVAHTEGQTYADFVIVYFTVLRRLRFIPPAESVIE
jgi:hypothetical protein